jgi:hypothetical protein
MMKRSKMAILLVFAVVGITALSLSGCAYNVFGTLAPSNVPVSQTGYKVLGPTSGGSCTDIFIGIPLGESSVRAAVKQAISKVSGANALINITVNNTVTNYYIVQTYCVEVHGTAIRK